MSVQFHRNDNVIHDVSYRHLYHNDIHYRDDYDARTCSVMMDVLKRAFASYRPRISERIFFVMRVHIGLIPGRTWTVSSSCPWRVAAPETMKTERRLTPVLFVLESGFL